MDYNYQEKLVKNYNKGEELITDELYDNHFDVDNGYKNAKLSVNRRVELPYYCGSLDKKLEDKEIEKWISNFSNKSFVYSPKYDGISLIITSDKAYTRGNGKIGLDVTNHYIYMNGVFPEEGYIVRGEVVCHKSNYLKYSEFYKGTRQIVSATFNTIKPNKDILKEFTFYAFWVINIDLNIVDQLELLSKWDFNLATYYNIEEELITKDILTEYLLYEEEENYPVDGLVILNSENIKNDKNTDGNPDWAFAFKREKETYLTKVIEVKWKVSKLKRCIPVIYFDPIVINESTITRCTGHNAELIEKFNIGKDSIIKIGLGNDIIPKLFEVVKSTIADLPNNTIWDENHTHLLKIEDDDSSKSKKLLYQLRAIGITGIGELTCLKAINDGKEELLDFLDEDVKYSKFLSSSNIIEHLKVWTLLQSLKASTFFTFCSDILLQKILDIFENDIAMLSEYDVSKKDVYNQILAHDGFGDKRAKIVTKAIFEYNDWMENIPYKPVIVKASINSIYYGKIFCLSGTRDKKLKDSILNNGGKVVDSLTKKVNYLITAKNENTTKVQKANKYNIPVMTIKEFYETI